MDEKVLLTETDIRRALVRLAHEVVERNRGCQDVVLVGMHTRGVPLAKRLAGFLKDIEGADVPVGSLDISLYRDDLPYREQPPLIRSTDIPADIVGKVVILVDDVLFTGRSIRAAMDASWTWGVPDASNSVCWWTGGIASCPSGRTMWAGTCPPPAMRTSGFAFVRWTARRWLPW